MELLLGLLVGLVPIVLIVLVIVYIGKTNSLLVKIGSIEQELYRLKQLEADVADLSARVRMEDQDTQPTVVERIPDSQTRIQAAASFTVSTQPVQQSPAFPQPVIFSLHIPPSPPSRTREEWEALIGGKLLNRIGALALIIGVGFFLKYAFDNNWITETMRVGIGFVIGAGLLIGASRADRKEFEVFAQGLIGAGLAVLYISVFASFNFYHLVPQTIAFLLMSAVTMLAFLQAFKYDSLAVSVLALVGGVLTPFVLTTGEANEVGLFTYIALLDAGIVAVLLMKDRWAILEPLALVATYLIYLVWYKEYYVSDNMLTTVYLLIVFWALFYVLDVYRGLKAISTFVEMRVGVAATNTLIFYCALYSLIEPDHHSVMGGVTLLVGAVYFGTALLVRQRSDGADGMFFRQILTAIILLVVATAIEFAGFKTVTYWSVEALVLVLCGLYWRRQFIWASGVAIYGFALLKLLYNPESLSTSPVVEIGLLFNQRAFAFAMLAATVGISAEWLRRKDENHRLIARILDYLWPVILFVLITVETIGYFKTVKLAVMFKELMSLAVIWIGYSLALLWSGMRKDVAQWIHVALVVALLSVCMCGIRGLTFSPIEEFQLLLNFRVLTMLAITAGVFVLARWIRHRIPLGTWNTDVLDVMGVIIVMLLLDLVTGETKDYFEKAKFVLGGESASAEYSRLNNLQQLLLSGVWLLYSILLMGVGIWRRQRGIRITSIVLFGFTILKIFIYDLSFLETLYRIFSFVGLGIILLAVSYLYQKYKHVIFGEVSQGEKV